MDRRSTSKKSYTLVGHVLNVSSGMDAVVFLSPSSQFFDLSPSRFDASIARNTRSLNTIICASIHALIIVDRFSAFGPFVKALYVRTFRSN
jgi:hypothetical protein